MPGVRLTLYGPITVTQSRLLLRLGLGLLRFATNVLPIIAAFFTVAGLLLNASTYELRLTQHALPLYPRYQLAQEALAVLEDRRYPAAGEDGKEIMIGVLDIDHPSWTVLRDFLESEIAIRKSERSEPGPAMFTPPTLQGASEHPSPIALPSIDFDRIKTIVAAEVATVRVGPKPLTPPYRLIVLWPHAVSRRVYEFLSFQEFRLDLRQMLILELRFVSIVASGLAFATATILSLLRWALRRLVPQLMVAPSPSLGPAAVAEPSLLQGQGGIDDNPKRA